MIHQKEAQNNVTTSYPSFEVNVFFNLPSDRPPLYVLIHVNEFFSVEISLMNYSEPLSSEETTAVSAKKKNSSYQPQYKKYILRNYLQSDQYNMVTSKVAQDTALSETNETVSSSSSMGVDTYIATVTEWLAFKFRILNVGIMKNTFDQYNDSMIDWLVVIV